MHIGYHNKTYEGLRKIQKSDIPNNFKNILSEQMNKGIKHNCSIGHFLVIDEYYLLVNGEKCYFENGILRLINSGKWNDIMTVEMSHKRSYADGKYDTFFIKDN